MYGIKPNARHVNLPYPGVYILDRDGVVTQKRFYESYRERDTGTGLIAQALGIVTESSGCPCEHLSRQLVGHDQVAWGLPSGLIVRRRLASLPTEVSTI